MSNRFTKKLEQLTIEDDFPELRFNWVDLTNISPELEYITAKYFFGATEGRTFSDELNQRWVFLCLLATMSDADIDELIINWKE